MDRQRPGPVEQHVLRCVERCSQFRSSQAISGEEVDAGRQSNDPNEQFEVPFNFGSRGIWSRITGQKVTSSTWRRKH